MKADKAVCTNDRIEDLNKTIRFETVFSTLVENKILAIKRECEQKKKTKRCRAFFGKKKIKKTEIKCANSNFDLDIEKGCDKKIQSNPSLNEIIDETKSDKFHNEIEVFPRKNSTSTTTNNDVEEISAVVDQPEIELEKDRESSSISNKIENTSNQSNKSSLEKSLHQDDGSTTSRNISDIDLSNDSEILRQEQQIRLNKKILSGKENSLLLEQERSRLRIFEARSISAQCSPIFPRQKIIFDDTRSECRVKDNLSDNLTINSILSEKELEKRISKKSSTSLVDNSNSTSTTTKKSKNKRRESTSAVYEYDSIINYQPNQGFISSFNQLTSNLPVITTTKTKNQYCDAIKLQRMTSTSTDSNTGHPTGCCRSRSKDSRGERVDKESGVIEENTKKNNKKKKRGASSEPVLVYPSSSSGLQHCILSRPPNQPLQLEYDEDFLYDVSLQIEPDSHDELDTIIPGHRKHKHRHHKHGKKKRHKRRKVLIHDLDERTVKVKVIDPDDLSQRARWTIIATACLLLIMCLLLVGVTLRMAPLIDDMVRQENERLMQESLGRKFYRNTTEPTPLAKIEIP